MYNLKLE